MMIATGDCAGAGAPAAGSIACSWCSSASRPANPAASGGTCAGAGADPPSGYVLPLSADAGAARAGGGASRTTGDAAGRSSAASIASTCWWILVSSLPGSMPRSSASRSLALRNTCSASACLPHRYSAIISSPCARSRSGCSATSAVRSGTTSAAWPWASSRSARSSVAAVCNSRSRCRSDSANGPGTPANGRPRHSASASSIACTPPARSPDTRRLRARPMQRSNCSESRQPGSSRSMYPPPADTSTRAGTRRDRSGAGRGRSGSRTRRSPAT